MSSVVLNIKEGVLSKLCLCNVLISNIITPPRCQISISLELNSQNSYLTKFHKVCRHALRIPIVITQFNKYLIKK